MVKSSLEITAVLLYNDSHNALNYSIITVIITIFDRMKVSIVEKFKVRFGQMIRKKRKAFDLTQEKLAEIIGVTPGAIGQFERGETMPNSENLIALIRYLHLNPQEVFFDATQSDPDYIELCSIFSQMSDTEKRFLLGFARYMISNKLGEIDIQADKP